jgi:YwiC-like protein
MRPEAKGYFLKEYGSWSVLIVAYLIGIGVSRAFSWTLVPLFLSLGLLINSKQAFTKWNRGTRDRRSLVIFLAQIAVAAAILIPIFGGDVPMLLPLLIFPAAYLISNKIAGEHFILTEMLGFALISLAAVLAKFLLTGGLDVRLFLGVALYFTAGVFKVKTLLLRKTKDRVLGSLYILFSVYVYFRMHIPLLILLPLIDNLIVALRPYKVKLKTTGWIEVAKSLVLLGMFIIFY